MEEGARGRGIKGWEAGIGDTPYPSHNIHVCLAYRGKQDKNHMDESKTKESILVFYSHNIKIGDNLIIFSTTKKCLKSLSRFQVIGGFRRRSTSIRYKFE